MARCINKNSPFKLTHKQAKITSNTQVTLVTNVTEKLTKKL